MGVDSSVRPVPPPRPATGGGAAHPGTGSDRCARVSEAAPHPILRGMRSGAIAGLALVAVPRPARPAGSHREGPLPGHGRSARRARVWAAEPVARAAAEPPVPPRAPARGPVAAAGAGAEPVPSRDARGSGPAAPAPTSGRGDGSGARSALSLDLIPVLDDASGALTIEEPASGGPAAKPVRPARAAAAKPPRTP